MYALFHNIPISELIILLHYNISNIHKHTQSSITHGELIAVFKGTCELLLEWSAKRSKGMCCSCRRSLEARSCTGNSKSRKPSCRGSAWTTCCTSLHTAPRSLPVFTWGTLHQLSLSIQLQVKTFFTVIYCSYIKLCRDLLMPVVAADSLTRDSSTVSSATYKSLCQLDFKNNHDKSSK